MKRIVRFEPLLCKACGKPFSGHHQSYLANPFCNDKDCLDSRLEASGAVDLRDNHIVQELGNGYVRMIPIDPNKKWKAPKKEKKHLSV